MTPQAARLPQRSSPTSFPFPMLALRAFLARQRSRREASFALFRPFGCGAIRPWLEIAGGRDRRGPQRKTSVMTMNSPLSPLGPLLSTMKLHLLLRIFWTNWLRTAIAPWTTNQIRAPCPLLTPRPLRSSPPSKLCPTSFSIPVSRPIFPTSGGHSSISFIARRCASTANSTTTKPHSAVRSPNRMARKSARSNLSG
jgi:hypothetical protein